MTREANTPDLLDAITAGIEDANPAPAPESEEEQGGTEEISAETDSTGEEAETEAGTDGTGEETETEADAGASAEEEKPEGEQTPEEKAVANKKAEEEAAAKAAAEAKQPDPVNDPLPPNLKRQTRERITKLIDLTKTATAERDSAVQQRNEVMNYILDSKATPQQYSEALGVLKLINSGTPDGIKKAIDFFQQQIGILARAVGEPVAGVDMLANHPDLQREVKEGLISQQRASELAAVRDMRAMQANGQARQTQQTQAEQQASQEREQGRQALNTLDASLRSDPNYAAKRAVLVESLKPVFAQIHPSQWATTFKTAWDRLQVAPLAPPTRAVTIPKNQPLRARSPAGGGAPAIKSLDDAINFGISQAR